MEPVVSVGCSQPVAALAPGASIWQDVLAQAITGELLAAMNYSSLAEMCEDPGEAEDALEHAAGERGHATRFRTEARKIGVYAGDNVDARHWGRLRNAFLGCIKERDFIGCLIVQEIMLESFAVASYARVGKVAPGSLGKTFRAIAAEEAEHVDHAMAILDAERSIDASRFDEKLYALHLDVMTTLAKMTAKECKDGHCEVCQGSCVKPSLSEISLSAAALRGVSLRQYLETLDALGLPGEVTLTWVAQLPV